MVSVHGHIHGHIHRHAGEHGRLLAEALVAKASRIPAGGEQHLRMVEMLLTVVLLGGTLSRMDDGVFEG